jgi:hypothetical protein
MNSVGKQNSCASTPFFFFTTLIPSSLSEINGGST